MHRFREHWLALFGGILLLTLSVSSVFGAPPTDAEGNRGQSISAFVHGLVFGDEGSDEPTEGDEEQQDEGSSEDETSPDEAEDDDASEADARAASSHGACVSEVARDTAAVGGPNENHGGAVSEAARVTCWEDEASQAVEDTDASEENAEDEAVDEAEAGAHGACVSEVARDKAAVGGPNENHGGAVSEAARVTCREDEEAEGDEATEGETEATSVDEGSNAKDRADRPGKGNGRDKADRPGKGGRGNGRSHR